MAFILDTQISLKILWFRSKLMRLCVLISGYCDQNSFQKKSEFIVNSYIFAILKVK